MNTTPIAEMKPGTDGYTTYNQITIDRKHQTGIIYLDTMIWPEPDGAFCTVLVTRRRDGSYLVNCDDIPAVETGKNTPAIQCAAQLTKPANYSDEVYYS